ncbi:MAG: hypothetical protein GY820_17340 [Gammaproteobacteria bacterium]|nr:hypothetical protein [Gammaproteobacteria bacterium]
MAKLFGSTKTTGIVQPSSPCPAVKKCPPRPEVVKACDSETYLLMQMARTAIMCARVVVEDDEGHELLKNILETVSGDLDKYFNGGE